MTQKEFKTKRGLTVKYEKLNGMEQLGVITELKDFLAPILDLESFSLEPENVLKLVSNALKVDKKFFGRVIDLLMNFEDKEITILGEKGKEIPYMKVDDLVDVFQIAWELFKINFTVSLLALGLDLSALPKMSPLISMNKQ